MNTIWGQTDSTGGYNLRYPLESGNSFPFSNSGIVSPLLLPPPSNVKQSVIYDPESNTYIFNEKIGGLDYRPPSMMNFEDYQNYQNRQTKKDYWQKKSREESGAGPGFMKGFRLGNKALDKVFGSEGITITPQGSAELIFGYAFTNNKNPSIPIQNQKNGSFIFKERIMMNVTGSIGDKMEVGLNYNTEATFEFENKTKLQYSGKEDEIIKNIEAGDVSFSLPGTLITGSQSLFGIKTELQFGRLTVAAVLSNQRSESSSVNVQGGAQQTDFEIDIDKYDVNRHFFLSHFFRDNYNKWLQNPQNIESQVLIESIEVWVVNRQGNYEQSRNIVGVMDLGEGFGPDGEPNFLANANAINPTQQYNQPADNNLNRIYAVIAPETGIRDLSTVDQVFSKLSSNSYMITRGRDYVTLGNARPLSTREFTVNKELGYISLNSPLRNDEILAVAYVYTYQGKTKKVGELTNDQEAPNNLIVKLLKSTIQTPKFPNWDLMMKNVYAIGAYQVGRENFLLNVLYRNDKTGVATNYLKEDIMKMDDGVNGEILLKVMELDNLDGRNEPFPDGSFDFIEGVTINSRNGRVIFPLIEPFGKDFRDKIIGDETNPDTLIALNRTADKYVFEELYDSTQTKAQQISTKNKFFLQGHYQGSGSSDIMLNAMNVPEGSVKVTAGGVLLTENVDYTVDYSLGRVKILNQGLMESGTPISVSLESNSFFNIQQKTLMGTHLDYRFSENFNIGGTLMRLNERPLTQKVNIGEEPISNTIWGLNTSYRTESQFLTTLVDKLPFIETKETSSIAIDAEFAQLIPGQSKIIGENGIAYIDDFEGAQTKIELKSFHPWTLASPPQNLTGREYFTNGNAEGIESGYGRGKLSWYIIDPVFYGSSNSNKPSVREEDLYSHEQREVLTKELFPNKDDDIPGFTSRISVLNLNFYPDKRGPYNFDPVSLSEDLPNPEERWGGIMRQIITTDFEASNIEYIEFWLMDPYLDKEDVDPNYGGDLYFQLGEVSEDILRDTKKSFENGYPTNEGKENTERTEWGFVPKGQSLVNAFDNDPESRKYQDIGLDGLSDEEERSFHDAFETLPDPSGDNFEYFLSNEFNDNLTNIKLRYKNINGMENSTPVPEDNQSTVRTVKSEPDVEDINKDNTLNTTETYYQYRVSLKPQDFNIGSNYIVDEVSYTTPNNTNPAKWYQFRIPVSEFENRIGQISDFKSIRFMRLMLNGFSEEVVLRFASLELVRGEWRRYSNDLQKAVPSINEQHDATSFEVSAVNIEENGNKQPVNYTVPPGISRQTDPSQPQVKQLNEQSLLVKVQNLQDNDAKAVFKNTQLDLRQYKKLTMHIHAEALPNKEYELVDKDITAFIRIGSDQQNNYYEYEIPLLTTRHRAPGEILESEVVWPDSNRLNVEVQKFVDLKVRRNKASETNSLVSAQSVYIENIGQNRIKVKGNPNLSNIRVIMLGVRNPGDEFSELENDALEKSAEVWFNELRLEDFNNDGGWAANGRVQAQLADLGIINVAGATSKAGFGSIDQQTEERQREELNQIDISSNLEMGKFFPEKSKVSIPLYVGYANTTINPEYYPKDPDRKLKDVIAEAETAAEKKKIKKISQDKTERSSINVTNVRWNKQFKKFKVFQPSNLSATVLYTETKSSNYSIDYNKHRKYGASLNYVYNNRPKPVTPFKSWKAVRKPAFRIIRDFNFNYLPSSFTFGTKFDRNYQSMKVRNVYDGYDLIIDPTTSKVLYWDRNYSLKWDLTRALRFDYTASNNAIIDEPQYDIDGEDYRYADLFEDNNQTWKNEVWSNMRTFGRNLQFNQKFSLSYTLPLNKIPALNWTNLKASYDGLYSWTHGPTVAVIENETPRELGHALKNGNTIKLQGNFNMKNLYNKVGYLKTLDRKYNGRTQKKEEDKRYKEEKYNKRTFITAGKPKNIIHKLGTEDVTVTVTDAQGNDVKVTMNVINSNKITIEAQEDLTGINILVIGRIEKGENPLVFVGENAIRLLLGFKNVNLSYNNNSSTMISGYRPRTNAMGFDMGDVYNGAPGYEFILGWQDTSINRKFDDKNWLTQDSTFSIPTMWGVNESFSYRTTFEPFKGFRIDFSGMRNHSYTTQQKYQNIQNDDGSFKDRTFDDKYTGGNYSRSVITISSAFENLSTRNNWESSAFNQLKANRSVISQRLSAQKTPEIKNYKESVNRPVDPLYGDGYSSSSSEVLMYSFLSAYTGTNPDKVALDPFSWVMMPNWKITFDGLSKVNFIQKFLKTLTLNHSYKSTYTVGQYSSNIVLFDEGESSGDKVRDFGDFIPKYRINTVSINEQLSPLIGIDMTWHSSLLTKFEWKTSRLLALSLTNQQLTETRNRDIVFGLGYKFKDVPLNISTTKGSKSLKSDLNLRFDATLRDNVTILRSLNETTADIASTGARKWVLGLTADYLLSERVNIQFYCDYNNTSPFVSSSFPNSEFSFGFSLRLSL